MKAGELLIKQLDHPAICDCACHFHHGNKSVVKHVLTFVISVTQAFVDFYKMQTNMFERHRYVRYF